MRGGKTKIFLKKAGGGRRGGGWNPLTNYGHFMGFIYSPFGRDVIPNMAS